MNFLWIRLNMQKWKVITLRWMEAQYRRIDMHVRSMRLVRMQPLGWFKTRLADGTNKSAFSLSATIMKNEQQVCGFALEQNDKI